MPFSHSILREQVHTNILRVCYQLTLDESSKLDPGPRQNDTKALLQTSIVGISNCSENVITVQAV